MGKDFSDHAMQGEGGFIIHGGGIAVDEDQIPTVKIMDERSGRIDREGSACNDEHIGSSDSIQAFINRFAIELFLIEDNIGFNETATGTTGNASRGEDLFRRIALMTLLAVIAVNAAVQFQDLFAASHLVQTINILRDNGRELSGGFQLRQLAVGCIGTGCKTDHLLPVEIVKLRRVADKKAVMFFAMTLMVKMIS